MANLQVGVAGNGTVTVGAGASVHSPASNTLTLGTNNSEVFRIASDGKIGIGSDSPSKKLHVHSGTSNNVAEFESSDTGAKITLRDPTTASSIQQFGGQFIIDADSDAAGGSSVLLLRVDGSEKVRIDSSGNLGIGTDTPGHPLHVRNTSAAIAQVQATDSNTSSIVQLLGKNSSGTVRTAKLAYDNSDQYRLITPDAIPICFLTQNSERMRIDSAGDVLIGHTSSTTVTGEGLPLQVQGSGGYTGASLIRTSAAGAQLQFAAGSSGNNVADNTGLGYIKFFGYHTNGYDESARIHAEIDGTPGDGDAPGAIVFSTTNDGASSVTERMRIKSSTLSVAAVLDVDASDTHNIHTDKNSWGWRFYQSNTSSPYGLEIKYDGMTRDDSLGEFINCLDTSAVRFKVTSDGDVWNHDDSYGGSDQTLKENIVDASPKLEDLKKLKVRNFNWKSDSFPNRSKRKMLGFIAQEVEEVFPSLIKEYNITGDNDNPVMKKAIKKAWAPILVKALQEAVAKIETLETKVAALESA